MRFPALLALLGASVLAVSTAGCGGSATSLCNQYCECAGCSDVEKEDCIDETEDAIKDAEDEGCSDQVQEYLNCSEEEFECRNGDDPRVDGCDNEAEALGKCMN